jgi:site-specific recombinase XerD
MHERSRTRWNVNRDPLYGPLGKYVESFEKELLEQGYPKDVAHFKVRIVWHLNKWLSQKNLTVSNLNDMMVDRFFRYYQKFHRSNYGYGLTLKLLLDWLYKSKVIPPPIHVENNNDESTIILQKFAGYLRNERGLSSETLRNYMPTIRRFLSWRFKPSAFVLADIKPRDVTKFLFNQTRSYSSKRIQLEASALRSFFRYLLFNGDTAVDLANCVPTVANRQRSDIPKYLQPKDVNRLLRSCDRTKAVGIRDHAILLLMVRLGLRAGELLTMTLDDINWEEGTIIVHGKTGRDEALPLPKDVGSAIVKYLKKSRPKCSTRRLFVRTKAPVRELARDGCICAVVRYACKRAGLSPKHQGAHLLRHSLATGMLNKGASMAEIAEILRHRSTQTTEIYAKLDMKFLRELAQPWPG